MKEKEKKAGGILTIVSFAIGLYLIYLAITTMV